MTDNVTREDMIQAGLSEQEINDYFEGEGAEAAAKTVNADTAVVVDDDGKPKTDSVDAELDAAAAAREAKGEAAPTTTTEDATTTTTDDATLDAPEFAPKLEVPEAKDYKALRKVLSDKFGDGDITNEEYTDQLATLVREETEASMARRINDSQERGRWDLAQEVFFEENPTYQSSKVKYAALNAMVIDLAPTANKEGWSGRRILAEAKKLVEADMPSAAKPADPKPADPPVRRKPDLKAVPTTLAHIPPAGEEEMGADKFAHIDQLSGMEQETAIAQLSEADREAWLRSA